MRILFYDAYARTDQIGGGSSVSLQHIIAELKKDKTCDISIIINDPNCPYVQTYQDIGISVYSNKLTKKLAIYGREEKLWIKLIQFCFHAFLANLWFFSLCRKQRFDCVVFNETRAAATFIVFARIFTKNIYLFLRGTFALNSPLNKLIFRFSKHNLCVSKGVFKRLPYYVAKKSSVVYDIYRPTIPRFVARTLSGKIRLISIGGITRYKGYELVIDALAHFDSSQRNRISYLVLGGINDRQYYHELAKLIQKNSLNDSVTFAGYQEDVFKYLLESDIFLIPSFHEGLGRVILEAFDANLPVIGSDTGGIPELVEDNVTGLLFERGNAEDLAHKISYLLQNGDAYKQFNKNTEKKLFDFMAQNSVEKIKKIIACRQV